MKLAKWIPVLLAAQVAFAHAAAVDSKKSSITATFTQFGVAVAAKFTNVSGTIDFDAANPANSKAQLAVPLASFDLGDPAYSQEIQKQEWFNTAQFPQATFVSTDIKTAGPGRLQVRGKLSIKGKTFEVAVPVAYKPEAGAYSFEGQLPLKRLDFNIGDGEWKDTDTLANEVLVQFKVVTAP